MDTYPGAVGGFRIMKLKPQGAGPPMMLSIGRQLNRADFEWNARRRNVMVCGRRNAHPGQRAPAWDCTCGFWFYKKLEDLRERVPTDLYGIGEGVYALLAGWGKAVEHEEGVRAEFARPLALLDERPMPIRDRTLTQAKMSDEKWRRWVKLIGLPMIAPEEIDIAAQMYGLEMLEYAKPPRIAQVLFSDGRIIFVDKDASPQVAVREGVTLPEPTFGVCQPWTGFGWDLEKRYYVDDMGRSQTWWGVRNAPESVMLHNQAQIERALRSPGTAHAPPRG